MPFKNNIDDALSIVGYGRWQIPMLVLCVLIYFLLPVHLVGSTILSVPVPFRCFSSLDAPLEATTSFILTSTTNQPLTVIYDSRCDATQQNLSFPPTIPHETGLPSCPFVEYDHSTYPNTIISEFNLVCERASLRPLYQMLISVGALFSSPVGGVICDRYGRKRTVIAGSVVAAIVSVVMAVCPWYSGVLLSRFVLGLLTSFLLLPSCSLMQETTPPRYRSQTGMLAGLGFSVSMVMFAGVGFLLRPWRYLMMTASSTIFIIIPLACAVEESPRWLAQQGRHKEVADTLERAARRNRVSITPELVAVLQKMKTENRSNDAVEEHDEKTPLSSFRQIIGQCRKYLRFPGIRIILIVTPVLFYTQTLLYLGILLNANNFTSNDPYIYVAISGVMDFTAIVLATPLTMRVGRRCLYGLLLFFSGVFLLLDIAVPADLTWLKWLLVMTAFLLSSASFQVLFIYILELYPTVIRSRGFCFVNAVGNLGWLTVPLITDLLAQRVWWSVNVVCGLAGLLASLLMPFLPETRNLPMPETLQDVERRRLGNKGRKNSEMVEDRSTHEADSSHKTEPLLCMESENSNLEMKKN